MVKVKNKYDLIIIGAGPAGLTASIYASRYSINHLVIGKITGGLASEIYEVENFPTEERISGLELVEKMKKVVEHFGAKIINDEVVSIERENDGTFLVKTRNLLNVKAKNIILALGTTRRKLNIPGEKELTGKGVSYCATCDGPFYKDKVVGVVGGSDAAGVTALYLSKIAKKVYIIYRRAQLRAEAVTRKRISEAGNIEVIYNNTIKELKGKDVLEEAILNNPFNGSDRLKLDGLFVEIGGVPPKELITDLGLKTDDEGYIVVDKSCLTSADGIFAAGDVSSGSNKLKQIITACAEGAIAANSVHKILLSQGES